ncbi:unnamed protein product [Sphagnum troendelagicum]|uniref:UDP-N-acetylglucosamine acyltransferase n=1 Tax=Sphagnum troendelagicum TaxID=128251 RepID=A0ABP0UH94_9BRYO
MLEKHLHEEIWRLQGHDSKGYSDFTEKRDVEQTKSLSPELAHEQADCAVGTAALATVLPGFKFIHATAVVHPDAVLGKGVVISAFCTVGPAVTLGIGCKLHAGSHVCGNTIIGDYCKVLNGAVVGSDIPGQTVVGQNNTIGYNAVVGIKCQDMKYKDYVHTGGAVAVHHFCQVDSYSFLAGGSMIDRDVPMYMMVSGDRAEWQVKIIQQTYQKLFMNSDTEAGGLEDRLPTLELNEALANVPAVVLMLRSVQDCFGEERRGICKLHWSSI